MSFLLSTASTSDAEKVQPDSILDEELARATENADLTLYFVNMVVVSASNLTNRDFCFDKSDPYCEVSVGGVTDATPKVENDLNPVWNERMSFFLPSRPESMELTVRDRDLAGKDETLGMATFVFLEDFFEARSSFEGELPLFRHNEDNREHGSISIHECGSLFVHVRGRTMRPIAAEIELDRAGAELKRAQEERVGAAEALDESELLRNEALEKLSEKEREIIERAEALEEAQRRSASELSAKDRELLDQAQIIEEKMKEMEEAHIAKREAELQKQEILTKLTASELLVMQQSRALEERHKQSDQELSAKEEKLLQTAQQLQQRKEQHDQLEIRLSRMEALKTEVQNELTSRERVLLDQKQQHAQKLDEKERELMRALEERDVAAKEAQERQENLQQTTLDELRHRRENESLRKEVETLTANIAKVGNSARDAQQEVDVLQVRNHTLEEKKAALERELEETKLLLDKEVNNNVQRIAMCTRFM